MVHKILVAVCLYWADGHILSLLNSGLVGLIVIGWYAGLICFYSSMCNRVNGICEVMKLLVKQWVCVCVICVTSYIKYLNIIIINIDLVSCIYNEFNYTRILFLVL